MSARNEEKDTLIASGCFRGHSKIKIQSVASSAGGTAMMAMVAQPYRGHLNGNVKDEFDMEECYARATVAGTQAQSLTVIVSPLDMQGMIGMMQVLARRAHTIHEVYRGNDNWQTDAVAKRYRPWPQGLGLTACRGSTPPWSRA